MATPGLIMVMVLMAMVIMVMAICTLMLLTTPGSRSTQTALGT